MSTSSATSPRPPSSSSGGSVDLGTLLITAVASAAAAFTCSKIWAPGTLPSAAFTPVLVALIKEAIARPAKAVTQAVPVRGVVRSTPSPAGAEPYEPAASAAAEPPSIDRVAQQGEISYHATGPSATARRWRLAIITGLLGFAIAAAAFTVPELVTGGSAAGGGGTTLFGGQHQTRTRPTQTTTIPGRTVTVAPTPTPTVTVPAPEQSVPAGPAVTSPAAPPPAASPAPAPAAPGPTVTAPPVVQP